MFLSILNQHAPLKIKLLCANHASYISKPLRKVIMKRSYRENTYFKKRKLQKTKKLLQQTLQKERKNGFNKLNTSFVLDNKLFWETVKSFFLK